MKNRPKLTDVQRMLAGGVSLDVTVIYDSDRGYTAIETGSDEENPRRGQSFESAGEAIANLFDSVIKQHLKVNPIPSLKETAKNYSQNKPEEPSGKFRTRDLV